MHPAPPNGQPGRNGRPAPDDARTSEQGGPRRTSRRVGRLLRIVAATASHTAYLSVAARRRPDGMRLAYRARRQEIGCRLLCRIAGLRVTRHGALPERGRPGRPGRLLVCNHIGLLDPIILASQMPVAFVAKAEIARWPLVGRVTREMGVFSVTRERRAAAGAFVEAVQERLRCGVDVLVFPEGRTSKGGRVLPFKTGAFAAVAGAEDGEVVPLALRPRHVEGRPAVGADFEGVTWADTDQTFAAHVWHVLGLTSVHYDVHVGDPIATAGRDRKRLAEEAHEAVEALLEVKV